MNNSGIEDILIGANNNSGKKKGKKGIIIVFFILLLILLGMIGAYWYYSNKVVSQKEVFVKHMSNTNIQKILDNNVYTEIYNRLLNENSKTTSSINFSTNLESEELENIDVSKFVLELTNSNDVQNSKSYNELGISYSGNEVLKVKLLSTENEIAVASDDIVNQYVGVHYDKLQDILGIKFDYKKVVDFKNTENIDLQEDEKNEYIKKYLEKTIENIPEEKFSTQENIVIEKDSESVDVTSHTLTLSQDEFNNLLISLLEDLKDDKELLEKLVTNESASESVISEDNDNNRRSEMIEENENQEINEEDVENSNLENQELNNENEDESINNEIDENFDNTIIEDENINQEEVLNENQEVIDNQEENAQNQDSSNSTITINPISSIEDESNVILDLDKNVVDYLSNYFVRIMLGKKLDTTVEELQENIDEFIEKIQKCEGNGLIVTLYASEEKTEKITITLPNENTIDLEFIKNTDEENNLKLTYLYKGNESIFSINNEDIVTYSADEQIENSDNSAEDETTNGFSLEIDKVQNDANTTVKAIYSFIEDKKINKKINLNLQTNGTNTSSKYENDFVITISTNEGENKVVIDNSINFGVSPEIEDLTEENCLFLETLSEEELNQTIQSIKDKIIEVYNDKKENLNFLDTNIHSSTIKQNLDVVSSNITIDEAREALITKVSTMMQEAIDKNEEFTIQNLADLTIDGYEVSSNITEDAAVIVVDIYTFNIDSNFILTDVE